MYGLIWVYLFDLLVERFFDLVKSCFARNVEDLVMGEGADVFFSLLHFLQEIKLLEM